MKQIILRSLIIALIMLAMGCAKKTTVVLLPDSDGHVGQVTVTTTKGKQVLTKAGQATDVDEADRIPSKPRKMDESEIQKRFGQALAAQPLAPDVFILKFFSGGAKLRPESAALMVQVKQSIDKRKSTVISVVGHADRAGSADYNLKLSLRRAKAVQKILASMGVNPDDIEITSHGENNPLVPTADNVHEPRNRRVEITVR